MPSIINATTSTGLVSSADNSGSLQLATNNGTTAVTIDTSQNVGIGTASPGVKLDVYGTIRSVVSGGTPILYLNNGTTQHSINNTSGALTFFNDATERMRIDSSGRLLVGATSASVGGRVEIVSQTNGDAITIRGRSSDAYGTITFNANSAVTEYARISGNDSSALIFGTGSSGSERMRIDSSGNLLVGTTSANFATGNGAYFTSGGRGLFTASSNSVLAVCRNVNTGSLVDWYQGGNYIGSVSTNGSTITYGGTSDYRLKDDIKPLTGALNKITRMKPCSFVWKNTGIEDDGFIAHELAEVCPNAVVGEKDAVNEDGSIKPQQIDTSFLVATLTAAIQELKAELDATKAEVQALKGVA